MDKSAANVPLSVQEVYVTEELQRRPPLERDYARENLALRDMASQMVLGPGQVLPRLVDLSMDLCDAVAGGISIYEEAHQVFRWHHLRGTLERFNGSTAPRNYSPCGVTMDRKAPVLVQRPERVYSWLVEADVSLPECLLVPLSIGTDGPIGTIWIVSEGIGHFTEGHSHMLSDIAAVAGIALHIIRSEERLRSALDEQKILTREMGHRLKNLFTIVQSMVPVAARRSSTTEEMARRLSARLNALSEANALVRPAVDVDSKEGHAAELGEVISAVLRPYEHGSITFQGPPTTLSQRGTNVVALILYELATNASKYGALSTDAGKLSVAWSSAGGLLTVNWIETGGPPITAAQVNAGFGTNLVARTVGHYKGTTTYEWRPTGLELTITLPESSIVEQ